MQTDWKEWSEPADIAEAFEIPLSQLDGCEFIVAHRYWGSYEGSAYVLFRRDGELYEVEGSHCSCYELEGQWHPERVTVAYLRNKLNDGFFYGEEREALSRAVEGLL